jgi:hypothetical protein
MIKNSKFKPSQYYYSREAEARAVACTFPEGPRRDVWVNIAKGYHSLGDHVDALDYDLERQVVAALRVDRVELVAKYEEGTFGDGLERRRR